MASSRARSSRSVLPLTNGFHRSISPSGRFYSSPKPSHSSSAFASSSAAFSSQAATFHRSTSPTRVNLYGTSPPTPSVRFSIDRALSPSRSIVRRPHPKPLQAPSSHRKTCMCAPPTHPGSFRCSLHRSFSTGSVAVSSPSNRLNARRSAMTNSLVRIGTVEGGDWVKRALAALIRPSSHQQRRRADFRPRPSRLSIMSKAED